MTKRSPMLGPPAEVASDDTLIAAIWVEGAEERVRYFTDESEARTFLAKHAPYDPLCAIGAWSHLDWEEVRRELERIRHATTPAPPIDDLGT